MPTPLHLKTLLGDHATTLALKRGEIKSPSVALDIADIPQAHVAFKRVVVIEFESVQKAIAVHDSPGYQAALKALGDGAVRDLRIVEGV